MIKFYVLCFTLPRYVNADDCCNRRCHKDYYLCKAGEIGCVYDNDCDMGLFCNKTLGDNIAFCDNTYCNLVMQKIQPSWWWHYYDGQCWGYISSGKYWSKAKTYCEDMGAQMVKITSTEDNAKVVDIASKKV